MSMDISISSRSAPNLPSDLPNSEAWIPNDYNGRVFYAFEAEEWLIDVSDAPVPQARTGCPDTTATHETYISLEPIGASPEAYAFLEQVVRALAKSADGFWEHPGDGRFYRHNEGHF